MKDLIKGKCLISFEQWFVLIHHNYLETELDVKLYGKNFMLNSLMYFFYKRHFSMQIGVLIEFFDSVGIIIEIQVICDATMQGAKLKSFRPEIFNKGRFENVGSSFQFREEAQKQSVIKASELYNTLNKTKMSQSIKYTEEQQKLYYIALDIIDKNLEIVEGNIIGNRFATASKIVDFVESYHQAKIKDNYETITSCGATLKKCNTCGSITDILDWA